MMNARRRGPRKREGYRGCEGDGCISVDGERELEDSDSDPKDGVVDCRSNSEKPETSDNLRPPLVLADLFLFSSFSLSWFFPPPPSQTISVFPHPQLLLMKIIFFICLTPVEKHNCCTLRWRFSWVLFLLFDLSLLRFVWDAKNFMFIGDIVGV